MKDQLLYGIADTRGEAFVAILCDRLKDIKASNVFLVRGRQSFVQCGAAAKIAEVKQKTDVHITEFFDFSANPKDEEARNGTKLLLDAQPDVIMAIGGGSVLDMAKLIRHYAAELQYFVPLWAIPTTSGTGAEATHFAVVYRNGKKCSVEAENILPDVVLLYSPFTYGNNAYLTACTGFDALAQAIEAFWNPKATEESDYFALRAIANIYAQLPHCLKNMEAPYYRDALMEGAYCAGRAINITKTTAPHAFSYAFTTYCGYPHGHAVAITFPFFAQLNMQGNPKREELCRMLGLDKESNLQLFFGDYIKQIGLEYKGTNGHNVHALLNQVNMERLNNNPVAVTDDTINEILKYIKQII